MFAVTSGKGGVGKTFVTANLAAALAQRGRRVLIVDVDFGLANLDVVLNLYPKLTLHDVLCGRCTIDKALVQTPSGFFVLPAGSGVAEHARLTSDMRDQFVALLSELAPRFDVVLLDTSAGLSDMVLFAVSLAQEVLLVVTPEPTSLTDAYAVIKVLGTRQRRKSIRMVVNQVTRGGEGLSITAQLQSVTDRFVKAANDQGAVSLIHMGDIPADQAVKDAIMRRQLLMTHQATSPAGVAVARVCARLLETALKVQHQPA